jgi:hypothetical protein
VARKASWFAACAACLSLIAVVACGAGPGATTAGRPNGRFAEATRLVIIGGSIAAGDGLAPRATPRSCGRSEASFGNIIARAKHFRLIEVACASAKYARIHRNPRRPRKQPQGRLASKSPSARSPSLPACPARANRRWCSTPSRPKPSAC